ncbi:MAG: cupin [Burkholderiales bacterium PBB2]|nr:MAG: cupin [Burkholderiales bacterium PBB2]
MSFDPQQRFVHLAEDGRATELPGGDAFWSLPAAEMAAYDTGWLVIEFECSEDWPNWERHPEGDEYVYLLSGAVQLLLEQPSGLQTLELKGRGAVLVPRGIWHTARVSAPSRLLHITRGLGSEHRPVHAEAVSRPGG